MIFASVDNVCEEEKFGSRSSAKNKDERRKICPKAKIDEFAVQNDTFQP